MKISKKVVLLISSVFAINAFGQTSVTGATPDGTSVVQVNPEVKEEEKRFSLDLGLEMSQTIAKEENVAVKNATSLTVAPSYKLNDLLTLGGKILFNQDNFGQRDTTTSDATFSLGIVGVEMTPEFKTTHSIGTVAPVSEESVKVNRLKGNISTTHGIAFIGNYLSLSYKVGIGRNFHEFTRNALGGANVEYRLSQIVELKVPFTEKFNASASGVYRIGRTYQNSERYSFLFGADLEYAFQEKLTANIGTSNDAAALKANGADSNVAAYNEKTSVFRGGLTYSY